MTRREGWKERKRRTNLAVSAPRGVELDEPLPAVGGEGEVLGGEDLHLARSTGGLALDVFGLRARDKPIFV
jgi:hypothetical protein